MDEYDGIEIICECAGRCGILNFEKFDDDEEMIAIQYFLPAHYHTTISWKESLKIIWALLRGKQYYFYDIILNKQQIEKLRRYLDK
jgi:hypothetical protein